MKLCLVRSLFALLALAGRGHATTDPSSSAPAKVEQWDVFELTLKGPVQGNPFTEVELSARFTQGERTLQVAGFYDGDGIYRIRFMPEATGDCRYETTSNTSALAGKTGIFSVAPATKGNHGPVRVAHTFHFAYADGTPYFQLGTTCYSWTHRSEQQEQQTLKTLAAAPFNKLRMCVFPQDNSAPYLRFFPFDGQPPRAWDKARFDPAFFRHLEERVAQLRNLGIEADLILFHPYDKVWGLNSMDSASDDRYVRYVVARLAAYRNVWWSLANEYDLNHDKTESDWDRLFRVVQSSDPYNHLRSIHHSLLVYNNTLPWVTHASIQNGAAVLDPERAGLYRDVYRKPIVYDEVKYEGDSARRWGQLSGEDLVLRFWNGLVAGTYVGHSEIFSSTSDPWLAGGGELRGQSVPRLAFLKTIMATAPAEGIEPIDKWQERRTGGKAGEYYLVYFGRESPAAWPFVLYKTGLSDGMKFKAEVIDTWSMTTVQVDGVFEVKKRDDYVFADKNGREVPLPGRPYMAIRIQRQP
jgi:Domain of unknown function (DUF5060)/Protein of unknown function (DUF4038)/Domain of unknown function (DUF5605)